MLLKICIMTGFILTTLIGFAGEPTQLPIPPDDFPEPPVVTPHGSSIEPSASVTISDTELAVFFEWSVGNATITVVDESNNTVYMEVVDTNSTTAVYIPVDTWGSGEYTLTVTYGTMTQRGNFQIE